MPKKDYIEDKKQRIKGERHASIVIKNKKILLIYRVKNKKEYYVFPGGHRRKKETGEQTVVRETQEETAIKVKAEKLVLNFQDNFLDKLDFYYLCSWQEGEKPMLVGEEAIRNCPENFYEPMWVDLKKIEKLTILPRVAKAWLLENIINI